jgi:tRNA threonylcarbamoyladenosine biosynthesis protein TsaE
MIGRVAPIPVFALAAAGWLAAAAPAMAHPHVFIETAAVVRAGERGIAEIRLIWNFDEMFSSVVIGDHDRNRDGKFQPDEVKAVQGKAFDNLKHYNYFLHVEVDGKPFAPKDVAAFDAKIVNQQLVYLFTIKLPRPAATVEISLYDPDFFIAFTSNEAFPVQVEAAGGAADCEIVKAKEIETLYGSFAPDRIVCTAKKP